MQVDVVIQYVASWEWLLSLSVTHLKFTHIVGCISTFFLSVAECSFMVWIDHSWFIHFPGEEHLVVSSVWWLQKKKAVINITFRFLCEYRFYFTWIPQIFNRKHCLPCLHLENWIKEILVSWNIYYAYMFSDSSRGLFSLQYFPNISPADQFFTYSIYYTQELVF